MGIPKIGSGWRSPRLEIHVSPLRGGKSSVNGQMFDRLGPLWSVSDWDEKIESRFEDDGWAVGEVDVNEIGSLWRASSGVLHEMRFSDRRV
jgi:hypothetical protein